MTATHDAVNPSHYKSHPSGIEAIEVTQHYKFSLGNAIKYLWRLGQKDASSQELAKARWYVLQELDSLRLYQSERFHKQSHVDNKGLTLGLIERYLQCEEPGDLKDAKELIMRAPFYVESDRALEAASEILARLANHAHLKETVSA